MTDYLTMPVVGLSSLGADDVDHAVTVLSEGRAPIGWGRLCSHFADLANIRAEVAAAVALKETGYFKYGGIDPVFSADPSYHNFGGIKTTDSTATYRFFTDALGIAGLVAHIAWYAHARHVAYFCSQTYDPRHFDWGHQAGLRVVGDFGNGIWNTGGTYAPAISNIIGRILGP